MQTALGQVVSQHVGSVVIVGSPLQHSCAIGPGRAVRCAHSNTSSASAEAKGPNGWVDLVDRGENNFFQRLVAGQQMLSVSFGRGVCVCVCGGTGSRGSCAVRCAWSVLLVVDIALAKQLLRVATCAVRRADGLRK